MSPVPSITHRRRAPLAALALLVTASCGTTPPAEEASLLVFPPPPAEPRVQFLTWASGSRELGSQMSTFDRFLLGEDTVVERRIVKPYGVAARDGVVYVCDTKGYNLTRLDFKERRFSVHGTDGLGRLRKPLNVAIDELGYKFVVDSNRKQVVVFGPDDEFVTGFDVPPPCHPVDLALHGDELFVLDNDDTPQVVVMSRETGEVRRSFGREGEGPGEFKIPNSLCVDGEGYLYVSDTLNFRVQKLTRDGDPVWVKGSPGRRLGQFGRPRGVRVGPDGLVYVVEGAMQLVQLFDSEGQILMRFGGPGNVPGAMVLPSTLAIDETSIPYFQEYVHPEFEVDYLMFVANQYGDHLINVYAFGSFPDGFRIEEGQIAALPETDASTGIAPVAIPPPDDGADATEGGADATEGGADATEGGADATEGTPHE